MFALQTFCDISVLFNNETYYMNYASLRRISKILKIFAKIVILVTAITVGTLLAFAFMSEPVFGVLFALIAAIVGGLIALLIFGMSEFITLMIENADNIDVMHKNVYLMTSILERFEEKLLNQNAEIDPDNI